MPDNMQLSKSVKTFYLLFADTVCISLRASQSKICCYFRPQWPRLTICNISGDIWLCNHCACSETAIQF